MNLRLKSPTDELCVDGHNEHSSDKNSRIDKTLGGFRPRYTLTNNDSLTRNIPRKSKIQGVNGQ